jgi:ABC-type Fe3+/spermidine/putrescine transport system ATPase subunit
MNAGRIDTSGPARQVFMNHRTAFSARFFGLNVIETNQLKDHGDFGSTPIIAFQREHARLVRAGEPVAQANSLVLKGRVATRSFQGLVDEYAIDITEQISVRVLDGQGQFSPGEDVSLIVKDRDLFRLQK